MQSRGDLRIDPGQLGADAFSGELELVVPYMDPHWRAPSCARLRR